jgi:pyroglutamyl-peptidase
LKVTVAPILILVTGFGGFPGSLKNPTASLMQALAKHRARLARLGINLELRVLPVVYAQIAPRLTMMAQTMKPDAILHFGLAARRKTLSIEARALNRVSLLHPDATGATAQRRIIVPGAAAVAKSTFPNRLIAAALCQAGLTTSLSIDAGDYVCNQTLFISLSQNLARCVGFIHVPRLTRAPRPKAALRRLRLTLEGATRAALIAIRVLAARLRFELAQKAVMQSSNRS